ncbi:hypothetical protein chiPu_0021286 [Chiloscyllium punctatum]|uniref:Immunoglobulin V-set domain-containing protein n=1 Tax=Chiloscyllium punctatum TaxID=137246 RepID=A0A401RPS8_CHIPU|nr:hypothetical protein [Chiloscyllium punctatum]
MKGNSATIHFKYSISAAFYSVQVYRQDGRQSPTFLIDIPTSGDVFKAEGVGDRFSAVLDTSKSEGNFTVDKLQLSDSAVHYCGLRDTVTGNRGRLVQKYCHHSDEVNGLGLSE